MASTDIVINKTYDQLFAELSKEYEDNFVPAAGLFWMRQQLSTQYAIRVVAPTIMREFSDGINLGRDPEGFLFFHSGQRGILDSKSKTKYSVYHNSNTTIAQRAVLVQFYTADPNKPEAQFLAKDPNQTVNWTLVGRSGDWSKLEEGSAAAHVKKAGNYSEMTIDIGPIGKRATFKAYGSDWRNIDVWGTFSFKTLSAFKPGPQPTCADYNSDRIIFYPVSGWEGSADFSGYFIPLESEPAKALQDMNFEARDVKWTDIPLA
ncbi:hypothetical protein B0H34DRAFT_332734 [Crassisporium funariophilum]|nr:hypothetical protein B0H34DRAFT_332734 [Crassisporium funariophilum]